jgi:hypothetical protein
MPFNVAASVLKDEDYKLQQHELEIMVEPVRILAGKYLPEALKKTDNPEVVMIGVGIMAYAARIGLTKWSEPKKKSKENPVKEPEVLRDPRTSQESSPLQPSQQEPSIPPLKAKPPQGAMSFAIPAMSASLPA